MQTFIAVLILWGVIWFIREQLTRSKQSEEEELLTVADQKKNKERIAAKYKSLSKAKESLRKKLQEYDLSPDVLSWLTDHFNDFPAQQLDKILPEIENLKLSKSDIDSLYSAYSEHLNRQNEIDKIEKENKQWSEYLKSFRSMNEAQQKYEIDRIKKIADPESDSDNDKIRILELISLQDPIGVNDTDVMLGGYKLFTIRKKR